MTVLAFTRPERRLQESVEIAEMMGFSVIAAPSLDIIPSGKEKIENIRNSILDETLTIFTSPTSVDICLRHDGFKDVLKDVLPIGPGTARTLAVYGIETNHMPEEYSSAGIVEHLKDSVKGRNVVIIRSDHGSPILDEGLRSAGAVVIEGTAYHLRPADPKCLKEIIKKGSEGKIDVLAFTSSLSARSFVFAVKELHGSENIFANVKIAAIGRPTESELARLGIRTDIMPKRATFIDMLTEIKERTE